MSAFRGKADMTIALRNVRFWPKADIGGALPVSLFDHLQCLSNVGARA
jgi:hypothetical protein